MTSEGKSAVAATLNIELVRRHAAELIERNSWTRQQLLSYQQQQLKKSLKHAVDKSPYYKETIGHLIARDAPLSEFPILTKRALMENFDRIVTDPRLNRKNVEQHVDGPRAGESLFGEHRTIATGGTSGERGVFVFSQKAWLSVMANVVRFQKIIGTLPNTRMIGIGAASAIHVSNRFYAEFRASRPDTPVLDVTMAIDTIVEALNKYQPEAITTYPSFMRVLAEEQSSGRLKIMPRFFRSAAEALTPEVRTIVQNTWNALVYNGYSSTEVGAMGQECLHQSGIHLAEDLSVYEIADENNKILSEGRFGSKLLITTLTNPTLPLVRYELTDVAIWAVGQCTCGLPTARLASLEGRREEILHFARVGGGTVDIHAIRLHSPLIGMGGLRQFQLIQIPEGLEIAISVQSGQDVVLLQQKTEQSIRAILEKLGVAQLLVVVKVVDEIARVGTGAKMKLVGKTM